MLYRLQHHDASWGHGYWIIISAFILIICHLFQNTRIVFNSLEGNYALCLLANLIHLGSLQGSKLREHRTLFTNVITKLLESCRKYVQLKKSNLTHWHPVLGYVVDSTFVSFSCFFCRIVICSFASHNFRSSHSLHSVQLFRTANRFRFARGFTFRQIPASAVVEFVYDQNIVRASLQDLGILDNYTDRIQVMKVEMIEDWDNA